MCVDNNQAEYWLDVLKASVKDMTEQSCCLHDNMDTQTVGE